MNTKSIRKSLSAVAVVGVFSFGLAACSESPEPNATPNPPASQTPDDNMTQGASMDVFGPGCAAVPKDGKGSFDGMSTDPVATAASNNPLLSTLVTAVGKAGLADTLNTTEDITVFAPVNDAFGAIPEDQLNGLLADKAALSNVLTHHVVAGRLSPEDLAGTHKTLAGDSITVEGSGEDFTVDGANVICGNVQTANATVYIIDGVLTPAG